MDLHKLPFKKLKIATDCNLFAMILIPMILLLFLAGNMETYMELFHFMRTTNEKCVFLNHFDPLYTAMFVPLTNFMSL